ncbi:MAG: GNAT family N-acetyltransferase [Zetaproteobacteria bacterium]|nr:GNAT family N-acetyltransferase [Zetaproteobacteria bacterium]
MQSPPLRFRHPFYPLLLWGCYGLLSSCEPNPQASFHSYRGPLYKSASSQIMQQVAQLHNQCFLADEIHYQYLFLQQQQGQNWTQEARTRMQGKLRHKISQERSSPNFVKKLGQTANVTTLQVEQQLVGIYSCSFEDPVTEPAMYLYNVCIHPKWRRRGLGKQLIQHAVQSCRRPHSPLYLTVYKRDLHVQKLYRTAGFQQVKPSKAATNAYYLFGKILMQLPPSFAK